MEAEKNTTDINSKNRLNNQDHDLDQFLQGSTVNLEALATYAIKQVPSDVPILRRHELLMFIALYSKLTHNAPSHRQIGMAFNLSKTTVKNHLLKLEHEGRIRVLDSRIMIIGSDYRFPYDLLKSQN